MTHSLRVKLKNLQRKGELTDKDIDRIFKALEQEPMPTMVYPQVEGITPTVVCEVTTSQEPSGETVSLEVFKQVMWERDIAIGQLKELGYGFGQKIESCDDAISREAVWDVMQELWGTSGELIDRLMALPPVNPQEPKTGRWIYGEDNLVTGRDGWYCNQCGHFEFWDYKSDMKSAKLNLPNLCPNCKCKMQEAEE